MKYDTQHTHDREITEVSKLLEAWKKEQDEIGGEQTPAEHELYNWITTGGWDPGLATHEEVHEHGRD